MKKITIKKFQKLGLLLLFLISYLGLGTANAQVGIGTTSPDASAQLELQSSEKGFLPPRMDTDARNGISSPADGLTIYNTDEKCLQWYNGSGWFNACDGSLFVPAGPISDCVSGFIPPFLSADDTAIVDVTNAVTGHTWMDRNLGAYTADRTPPASYDDGGTDCWAYGNSYQWGRAADGHEDRTSGTTTTKATTAVPNTGNAWHGLFITDGNFSFKDWLTPQDSDLWQGVNGTNNPCPVGYRLPTEAEWEAEWDSWDGTLDNSTPPNSNDNEEGAIDSPLKLPLAGSRSFLGALSGDGSAGFYWSSTVYSTKSMVLSFNSSYGNISDEDRVRGQSVRCIKD